MLLIASENLRTHSSVNDVAREMSFTLSVFASPATFGELMLGQSRRIVLLTEDDLLIDFPNEPCAVVALQADPGVSPLVQAFRSGALESALAEASACFPEANVSPQAMAVAE